MTSVVQVDAGARAAWPALPAAARPGTVWVDDAGVRVVVLADGSAGGDRRGPSPTLGRRRSISSSGCVMDADTEVFLSLRQAQAHRGAPPGLAKLLRENPTVCRGSYVFELRGSNLVAVRRTSPEEEVPRWRRVADQARAELRERARRGDAAARRELADLGELVAPLHPAADVDEEA